MFPPLTILYRDEAIVAIDKPPGLLVHRSRIDPHASDFALQQLRDQLGQPVFPIHRIDRPTSGVLLFALNAPIARAVCRQFEQRTTAKEYEAIIRGHPPVQGSWDEPLLERHDRITDSKASRQKPEQPAITDFVRLRRWTIPHSTGKYPNSRYSHVAIRPRTGRRHQIRRHFNHMAYPIIGDTTHGDRRHNRLFREVFGIRRLLLVARRLTFQHPIDGSVVTVEAPLGKDFGLAIEKLTTADLQ